MARLVFKHFRVSSVNAAAEVANVQNGESFVDNSTGNMYYKDTSGVIKSVANEITVQLYSREINSDFTVPPNYNAVSAGPFTIGPDATVTISENSSLSIN